MKVKELIEELKRLDPEEELYIYDTAYGVDAVEGVDHREVSDTRWFIL